MIQRQLLLFDVPRLLVLGLACFAFVLPGQAETLTVELDPSASEISFLLGATGHNVEGLLVLTAGEIRYDTETLKAEGELLVDATLATSHNARRDKAMHKKVLRSIDFPVIRFEADHLEGHVDLDGASAFSLVGTMTLLGVEHAFALPIEAKVADQRFEALSTFDVPYVEWGLHNPSKLILRVAKVVSVTVKVSGTVTARVDGENDQSPTTSVTEGR